MNATTLHALAAFPQQLEAYFAAIPDGFKHWSPPSWDGVPSEPFTAIEQICHVRDIEVDGYHLRFRRVLDEEHPTLPSVDGEALSRERSYATTDPDAVFAAFRIARATTLERIAGFGPAQLARTAVFEGRHCTLRSLVHFLCSHDQQHLAGLQWLLGQIEAQRPAVGLQESGDDTRR